MCLELRLFTMEPNCSHRQELGGGGLPQIGLRFPCLGSIRDAVVLIPAASGLLLEGLSRAG